MDDETFNIFDGVKPSFGPFASVLASPAKMLLSILMAVAFVYIAAHLIISIAKIAKARNQRRIDPEDASTSVMYPILAAIGLVALPAAWAVLMSFEF